GVSTVVSGGVSTVVSTVVSGGVSTSEYWSERWSERWSEHCSEQAEAVCVFVLQKVQKNGLAVDLEAVLKPAEAQNQSESPDPAGGKGDKEKKSKKKAKAPVKETTSLSERREPEEGTWETKVSQREKRQQRKKDKGAGDESGSPGGTELSSNAANPENPAAVEEPKIISTPSVTSTRTNTTSNTKTKTSNISTSSNTKTSTKNTKTTSTTPAPKAQKNSPRTQQAVVPVEHERPVAEVTRAVIPPVFHAWDVLAVNGSGSWDLGVSVPPHSQTWNSVKSEPSVWPQDMEGSWMIVDGSHIPVSLHGITA
ncbi:protein LYRIC isoform X2, partial [Tachysurus ichikawai]